MLVRIAVVAASFAVFAACGDGGSAPSATPASSPQNDSTVVPVTPALKPANVPDEAIKIEATTTLGRIERRVGEAVPIMTRDLLAATCNADLIELTTSQETIYAVLPELPPGQDARPCDRFWSQEVAALFIGSEAAIVLEVTDVRYRLLIDTIAGAQAEFTVAGIWVN